jgi:hypothetical protein
MLSLDEALKYVNTKTRSANKFREYAVSDFSRYKEQVEQLTTADELQKTWALYLKWTNMCVGNYQQWYSANGQAFSTNESARKFNYTPGSADTGPTIGTGPKQATVNGIGQCEYFATQAFQSLKLGGKKGTVPRVDKIATPGHNWVLVNYSKENDPDGNNLVAVDAWLLALGVDRDDCICPWQQAAWQFKPPFKIEETFNPDKQD